MANKRNRAPRNKKANNWKVIMEKKKSKKIIANSGNITVPQSSELSNDESFILNDQRDQEEAQPVIAPHFLNIQENTRNLIYQVQTTNRFETPGFAPYLSDDISEDENDDISEYENDDVEQSPLSSDDEEQNPTDGMNNANDSESNGEMPEEDFSRDAEVTIENEKYLTGRRIFEIADLFEQIKRIGAHSRHCSFVDMILIGEVKRGLNSLFKFQCTKCGVLRKLESCPKKGNSLNCNEEAVLGINSIGSGFSHLEEFLSQINVPCMGTTLYDSISKKQQSDWWNLAKESALKALKEEIELAINDNAIDSMGNALIAVICDGGWGKRSYGKKFNSLSGCAVLIGVRTKKVIFFGVRNKYCHKCKIAQSKCTPVNFHECNINYTGPSSGMEADIILEGFKSSEEHGARFYKLIADGDSSTYKTLTDLRIYKEPDLFVEKYECVNHLFRNFRTKFCFLSKVTKFNPDLRKHIKPSKGEGICKGIKVAAKHWKESNLGLSEKINNLEEDIMNAPAHYFGVHHKCNSYFCNKSTDQAAIDNLNMLKDDGLYYEVLNLCQTYFAGNAKSLLEGYTNNAAEEFNNLVAKYLGGKRINYSLAGSYTARVACAVVQYNSGGHAGTAFRKFIFGNSHQSSTEPLENKRKRKLAANEAVRSVKPRLRHVHEDTSAGAYLHGDGCEGVDMSLTEFERYKRIFLEKLADRQINWERIERETRDQKHSSYWHVIRRDAISSSHFHRIVKAKNRYSYKNILKEIMYKRTEFGNSAEIKHQRLVERDALSLFKSLHKDHSLERCGLFIDKELPYLCASPLRLYGNNHVVSIKCPLKQYNKNFEDVIHTIPLWKKQAGNVIINKKSDWFIELQGQLHITGRECALLMVWLSESQYKVLEIQKEDSFFETEIKPKLIYFYMEVMLKELVDSRNRRNMELREYNDESKSFI